MLPLSRGCTESAGRRTGSFGRDTADAEDSGAARGGAGALQWSEGVGGVGRRHLWNWLKAIWKGAGEAALRSLLRESGDAGTEIKRPPCGFTLSEEVEADT